jgi:AmmeMemoRadiSam system protein A
MSTYTDTERQILLNVAHASINEGLIKRKPLQIKVLDHSEELQQIRACFVTLEKKTALRGCIGSLQAHRPLIEDVSLNAFSAAFHDPRFVSLTKEEYKQISIHISILTRPKLMQFNSEADLLRQIRPGIDGLILSIDGHCGTFLPSVWEQLPTVELFFMHLKNKAGLPSNYWSDAIRVERYTTEIIE